MQNKKPTIIIAVLSVLALGLGYWVGLPKEGSGGERGNGDPKEPEFLKQGLVAYYPFNGNAKDESGNGNDGEVNGATLTVDRNGDSNSAYSFVRTHIKMQNELLPQDASPRSLSLWAKANPPADFLEVMVRWGRRFHNEAYGLYIRADQWNGSAYDADLSSGININTKWNYVVLTYDRGKLSIFLNGILCSETDRALNTNGSNLVFGCEIDSFDNPYDGKLDDIRIYNRALSEAEVKALYEFEKAK
jgi:hypothetical protein